MRAVIVVNVSRAACHRLRSSHIRPQRGRDTPAVLTAPSRRPGPPEAFATACRSPEDRVGHGGRNRRHSGLADSAGRRCARDQVHVDDWSFVDTRNVISACDHDVENRVFLGEFGATSATLASASSSFGRYWPSARTRAGGVLRKFSSDCTDDRHVLLRTSVAVAEDVGNRHREVQAQHSDGARPRALPVALLGLSHGNVPGSERAAGLAVVLVCYQLDCSQRAHRSANSRLAEAINGVFAFPLTTLLGLL